MAEGSRPFSYQMDVIGKRRGYACELHSELLYAIVQRGHPFFGEGVLKSHPLLEGAVMSVGEADV